VSEIILISPVWKFVTCPLSMSTFLTVSTENNVFVFYYQAETSILLPKEIENKWQLVTNSLF
jgi:hypothetical protein